MDRRTLWGSIGGRLLRAVVLGKGMRNRGRGLGREDGATIVEMAISLSVLLAMIFGIVEMCFAMYSYAAVDLVAREASRYAMIRGSNSCTVLSTFPDCNLNPTTTGNPLQTYVRGLYPGLQAATVSTAWYSPSIDSNGYTVWTTACTTLVDPNNGGAQCNSPGYLVKVTVSYSFPLNIPFVYKKTLSFSSTSAMMINQ